MIIDLIVSAVILVSAIIAFLRGFIRETLTILGTIGGLVAAYFGGPLLSPIVQGWLGVKEGEEDPARLFDLIPYTVIGDALAYGGIFIVVVILLSVLSHFLAESAKSLGLGAVDRTFGVAFGIVRGVVLLGLLYMPVHLFVSKEEREVWFKGTHSFFYLEITAGYLSHFLPEDTEEEIKEKAEELGNDANQAKGLQDKLKDIDLLQKDKQDDTPPFEEKKGYTPEFREKMDELFQEAAPEKDANE